MTSTAMEGRTALVTGASAGIGFETAIALAEAGAEVIGVGRDEKGCAASEMAIRELTGNPRVRFEVAELSSQRAIRDLAARLRARCTAIHVLVNNAGLFRSTYVESVDGIELQLAVNYLAGFLLTREILPLLRAAGQARVIGVSSGSHFAGAIHWDDLGLRRRYFGLSAYDQSKLAVVMFSYELARRLAPSSGISTYAVDPGLVKTDIGKKGTGFLVRWFWALRTRKGISPEEASSSMAFLAMNPGVSRKTGLYWKNKEPLPSAPASYSTEDAARLWEMSGRMCTAPAPAAIARLSPSLHRSGSFALR